MKTDSSEHLQALRAERKRLKDLQALQEERKHLETLFADRINFYLVFAAGVLAFLFTEQHPRWLVLGALWTVTTVSILMLFALARTLKLVFKVLDELIKDYPHEPYPKYHDQMPWYLPNANGFLMALPVALTLFFLTYAVILSFWLGKGGLDVTHSSHFLWVK